MRLHRLFLASCALVACSWSARAFQATQINFENAAKAFFESRGVKDAKPEALGLDLVLQKHFVHVQIGAFDAYCPRSGLEKSGDDLKSAAAALVDAQVRWMDWIKPAGKDQKAARDDFKLVDNWIRGWKGAGLAQVARKEGEDLAAILSTPDATKAALTRLAQTMQRGELVGPPREQGQLVRLYLMPTRKDFVEFMAVIGWLQPDQRSNYWIDSAADWMQAFYNSDQIIALEYATASRTPGRYDESLTLEKEDGGTMQQQIVQLAMNSFFAVQYESRVPAAFCQGLSMNLVIDLFGEINTRVDGDVRSRSAPAREVFVAGGQSEGGQLAKNSAETRWRRERGKDHWFHLLHVAQQEGADLEKTAAKKVGALSIRSDDGGKQFAVHAPFLGAKGGSNGGADAAPAAPPAEFQGDFAELLRAYKSGFTYWLQTKSLAGERQSRDAFAKMLTKLADPNLAGGFESVFTECYDKKPLSSATIDKDSLEGQFLLWLQKQK